MSNEEPTDEEIQQLEEELAKLEEHSGGSGYASPTAPKKDSTLVLFRELIKSADSKKFGYLTSDELGKTKMSVRDQLDMANYFDAEGLDKLGNYFRAKAESTFATSMSRKGWFGNLIVTQIKKEQKIKEPTAEVKKSIFGRKKSTGGVE